MALDAYLKLKGQQSGEVKGSCRLKGRDDRIVVIAASHDILVPRDPATGLSSGKRRHQPFAVTKELDRSSPILYNMMVTNENIVDWELQFWGPPNVGSVWPWGPPPVHRHSVIIENARIAEIRFAMPNSRDPSLTRFAEYEEVLFTYQSITWTWADGGIVAMDDWSAV